MQIRLKKLISLATASDNSIVFSLSNDFLRIHFISENVLNLYGYSNIDIYVFDTFNAFNYVSLYEVDYLRKGLKRCIEYDEPFNLNIQIKKNDESYSPLSGTCTYIGNEDDKDIYILSVSVSSNNIINEANNSNKDIDKRYTDAINFGNIFIWDYDLSNNVLKNYDENNSIFSFFPQITNYPIDFINLGIMDTKDSTLFLNKIDELKKGAESVTYEFWYHFPNDKKPKFIKVQYINEFDENNKPVIAHGMGIDLTELKNAENTFNHRTNAELRINPDSIGTFHINVTENTISPSSIVNPMVNSLLDVSSFDDLLAKYVSLIQDKNERLKFINSFSRGSILSSFNNGILQIKNEHHILFKNNMDRWVQTIVDIVKNPISGDIEAIMHIVNIHYRKVIDSMINGTVQREFDFIALAYIKTNSYVLIDRYNQSSKEEAPGFIESFSNMFRQIIQNEDELNRVLAELNFENLIDKINSLGEYTIQFNSSDDYEKNHHRILHFSFLNSRKDIISISCRDTTKLYNEELQKKEQLSLALYEAEKANRAKSDFLSLVSHDIRTPLNGIMGMTQLALSENNFDKVKEYLSKAEMASGFLLGLINDLLDMSKIEAGKIELHPQAYEKNKFIDYINSVIRPLCEKKHINFIINYSNLVSIMYVDTLRFNQIMFNLLSNACKYTNEFGSIKFDILCEKVNDSLCIGTFRISDTGIGMSEDFQDHLFETFSQENRMSFDHNEGTGLGLSITRSLIDLMGGEITVESEENVGTTFTVQLTFPYEDEEIIVENISKENISNNKEEKATENKNKHNDYTGCKFLLCEDNIINQEIAKEIFESLGATVDIADDGLIGIDKFNYSDNFYYSAIFMDIRMPNLDGLNASKRIRDLDRPDASKIPIIAMTANAMSEDKIECVECGMNAFIAKPINISELYKIMDSVIEL